MDKKSARITGGNLNVVDGEIVMILEPTGEIVTLDRWREVAQEHRDCCDACCYSSWSEATSPGLSSYR